MEDLAAVAVKEVRVGRKALPRRNGACSLVRFLLHSLVVPLLADRSVEEPLLGIRGEFGDVLMVSKAQTQPPAVAQRTDDPFVIPKGSVVEPGCFDQPDVLVPPAPLGVEEKAADP